VLSLRPRLLLIALLVTTMPALAAAPARNTPRLIASWNVDGTVMSLSVGPQASTVTYAITSTVLARIDTRTGRRDTLHVFWVPPLVPQPLAHGMTSNIVLSPGGEWIACAADGKLAIIDLRSRRTMQVLRSPGTDLGSIASSPTGNHIAGAGQGMTGLAIWDVRTGSLVRRFGTGHVDVPGGLAWSPRSDLVAMAEFGASRISLWDARDGRRAVSLFTGGRWSTGPVFSPDGRRLFALLDGRQIVAWDLKTRREAWRSSVARFGGSLDLHLSPDGRFLLTALAPDELALFDASSGRLLVRWQDAGARGYVSAFCPDRPIVVSGGLRGDLHLWDVSAVCGPVWRR
jgi:WD40 repeat protein